MIPTTPGSLFFLFLFVLPPPPLTEHCESGLAKGQAQSASNVNS